MSVRRAHSGSRRTFPCSDMPVRDFYAPKPNRYVGRSLAGHRWADFRCGPPCPFLCEGAGELHRPGTTAFLSVFSRYAGRRNAVRIFLQDSGKHPDIQIDSLADFAQTDEFVRAVRPRAVAYAQLQRRDVEQGLVRRRGRSVGRAAQRQSGPDDRVGRRDTRRLEPGRAGRDLASDVAADSRPALPRSCSGPSRGCRP